MAAECKRAGIGCIECKRNLIPNIIAELKPIQERRAELMKDLDGVRKIIKAGNERARSVAQATMQEVRSKLGF